MVKELMEKASTSTGLKVFASITDNVYKTARKASEDFRTKMPIVADDYLGQWNYRAVPRIA
jgi:Rhodopirellula transposase DDE domain